MATHPRKVTYYINKVSYNIQKGQHPNPVPSEYPNPTANTLKYYNALASRLGASDTHNLARNDHNRVLKVALAFWGNKE